MIYNTNQQHLIKSVTFRVAQTVFTTFTPLTKKHANYKQKRFDKMYRFVD